MQRTAGITAMPLEAASEHDLNWATNILELGHYRFTTNSPAKTRNEKRVAAVARSAKGDRLCLACSTR